MKNLKEVEAMLKYNKYQECCSYLCYSSVRKKRNILNFIYHNACFSNTYSRQSKNVEMQSEVQ